MRFLYKPLYRSLCVAGIIGFTQSDFFKLKDWSNMNADDITENGFYQTSGIVDNVPISYGALISFYLSTLPVQFQIGSGGFYYRYRSSMIWSAWKKLAIAE